MTVRCTDSIDFYGRNFIVGKKGHGYMNLKNAIKQSCDIYFYETARLLGVDRLNETARKFGLGDIVLKDFFDNEKEELSRQQSGKRKLSDKTGT